MLNSDILSQKCILKKELEKVPVLGSFIGYK
jgi:hypothetical protein